MIALGGRPMSRREGGGVSIVFGYHGVPASGEKRGKLTQPTEIDTHLTEKPLRNAARGKAVKPKKRAKLPKAQQQTKKAKPTKAATSPKEVRRQAEREARKLRPAALEKVIVVRRVGGEIKSVRKLGQ
jgi:hypothetical protein